MGVKGVPSAREMGYLTKLGVTMKQTRIFYNRVVMPHPAHMWWWRTRDVVENVVKPATFECNLCFAEYMEEGAGMGPHTPAEYFVSHSWDMDFQNFLQSLSLLVSEPVFLSLRITEKTAFWMDIFAINQNEVASGAAVPGSFSESDPFVRVIQETMGMVVLPDTDFKAVTRVWCLYEILTAIENKKRVVSMFRPRSMIESRSQEEITEIMQNVGKKFNQTNACSLFQDELQHALNRIDSLEVRAAQASCDEDRVRILQKVEKMRGGFDEMNAVLKKKLREGLHNVMKMVVRMGL